MFVISKDANLTFSCTGISFKPSKSVEVFSTLKKKSWRLECMTLNCLLNILLHYNLVRFCNSLQATLMAAYCLYTFIKPLKVSGEELKG